MVAQLEAVFFDLILEGTAADAQNFGGLCSILVRSSEGIDDHLLLGQLRNCFHFFLKRGGSHSWTCLRGIE